MRLDKKKLDELYAKYNRRSYVHPDPLEFVYEFDDDSDREVVALLASSLAYGRVAQILASVRKVLGLMGGRPAEFVDSVPPSKLSRSLARFRHRFTRGSEIAAMLRGVGATRRKFGSLNACFIDGWNGAENVAPGIERMVEEISGAAGTRFPFLLPSPSSGSACKRLNLFLRWMVRRDDVDPGGWHGVPQSALIIPLDTHMHRIGLTLGLTERKQTGMRTALEITDAFKLIVPDDPVRYDFCLTRPGIRGESDFCGLLPDGFADRKE